MKNTLSHYRSIMQSKIRKALDRDHPITVSFITVDRVIRPNKMIEYQKNRKVMHLNDQFIDNCVKISQNPKRPKSVEDVIIDELTARSHDNNSKYFIIS